MTTFYNDTFEGFYPVGTAAIVMADNQEEAAKLLEEALVIEGLPQHIDPDSMKIVEDRVTIVCNGNY